MHALALLIAATVTASSSAGEIARAGTERAPENLLVGPARCVLRYLDAVRLAGPRPATARDGRPPPVRQKDYAKALALTAPRTLQEIARLEANGEAHPLAPWHDASRARVLESFQLVAVRRAPRGAAVVTVKERFWPASTDGALEHASAEYLVARVGGEWRVVDRVAGASFQDASLAEAYAGYFDDPAAPDPGTSSGPRAPRFGAPMRAAPRRAPRPAAPSRGRRRPRT
jgi:hypothetical protein